MRGFANHYRIWTDHGEVNHGEVQGEGNTPLNDVDNRDPVHEVEVDRMLELVNDVLRNQVQDDPCTKAAKFGKYMNEANQEFFVTLALCNLAFAFEPSPLQDFCVADSTSSARLNGLACKNPMNVQADDFFFSGLIIMGNTSNPVGFKVTPVTLAQLPGLNTLGISIVRIDRAPWGINPPHTHPRATEILTILEGSLQVGFVTSNPENRIISKVLQKGDVFVFPVDLFTSNAMWGMEMLWQLPR
ncbi:hypothetical protein RJ639_018199 [Escallonia herrerae]|uniref:Germin-like protein n=1 Tax=Escallonia herrerae TaxID=1293975 RepID=A0AA88V9R8_9ASTE|nr:hypothetical protein RJ639_018199 [Escallonia herrerae]